MHRDLPKFGAKVAYRSISGHYVLGFSQTIDRGAIEGAGICAIDQLQPSFLVLWRIPFQLKWQHRALDRTVDFRSQIQQIRSLGESADRKLQLTWLISGI